VNAGDPVALLMRPQTRAEPYSAYAELRQSGLRPGGPRPSGLHRSPLGLWATASHPTAASILRDQRFSTSPAHLSGYRPPAYPPGDPRGALPAADLLTMDAPDHTRLRRLVSGAFSTGVTTRLEPWTRDLVGRLLAPVDAGSGFDLIDELAFPLSITVICHLLGVPARDQASFRAWGHDIVASLDPGTAQTAARMSRSAELALAAYLRELIRARRGDPDDSLLSALVTAEEDGDRLSSTELLSVAMLVLVAGFETTANLIGNGVVALLRSRDQWGRLHDDPALVPGAVEELLRYDSPVQLAVRIAAEDIEVGDTAIGDAAIGDTAIDGTVIRKGEQVMVAIGGANRDPAVFDQPDRLWIDRPNASRHLAFSYGIHRCLGAALARLEARVALEELSRRYPRLELAGTPTRLPLLMLRGFEHVPLRSAQRCGPGAVRPRNNAEGECFAPV
jgi:cytochrome P450